MLGESFLASSMHPVDYPFFALGTINILDSQRLISSVRKSNVNTLATMLANVPQCSPKLPNALGCFGRPISLSSRWNEC